MSEDASDKALAEPEAETLAFDVSEEDAGARLDAFLAAHIKGVSRTALKRAIEDGDALVDGRAAKPSHKLRAGEHVEVELPAPPTTELTPEDIPLDIVYEDDEVVVVNKPAGMVVHPGAGNASGTLVHGLLALFADLAQSLPGDPARPGVVHRLDKGTSGLIVVARTEEAYSSLVHQMATRTVERRYLALVWGAVESSEGVVDAPVGRSSRDPTRMAVAAGGRPARTRYTVAGRYTTPAPLTLLECSLETGRTHQVRVHLAAIGHPVVGDNRYGKGRPELRLGRPFLHAHSLDFDHPRTGARTSFSSPLPPELAAVLSELT